MKICFFSNLYKPYIVGGAEISTQLLVESLLEIGYKPVVISISDKNYTHYINGIKIYYLKHSNLYWGYKAKEQNKLKKPFWHFIDMYNHSMAKLVKTIILEEKPDIAHTNNLAGFSVSVWKVLNDNNIPIIHTLRDYYLLCPQTNMFKNGKSCETQCPICKFYSTTKKFYSKYVDAVIGISKFILEQHKMYNYFINAILQEVIYNPIYSLNNYEMNQTKKDTMNKRIHFGYVGMLSPHKGIEFILNAFLNIKDAYLYIFGKGTTQDYENYLKHKYNSSNINFMGYAEKDQIYQNIDTLIVPSLWNEPFGRVIPEAYSYGIPVVASNVGGIPELIDEGNTGFLLEPGNTKELISVMRRIVDNPNLANDLRMNCFKKAEEFFLDKQVCQYLEIYQQLLK